MWGGTVKQLEKVKPLAPRDNLTWTEHVAPFRGTGGLAFANEYFCANVEIGGLSVVIMLSPVRTLPNVEIVLGHRSQQVQSFNPRCVVKAVFPVPYEGGGKLDIEDETIVVIKSSGAVVGSFRLSPLIFDFDFDIDIL